MNEKAAHATTRKLVGEKFEKHHAVIWVTFKLVITDMNRKFFVFMALSCAQQGANILFLIKQKT